MKIPSVYRTIQSVFNCWIQKSFYNDMPKMWRFTIYTSGVNYILQMISDCSDAYESVDNRVAHLNSLISNLRKVQAITRAFCESHVISIKKMDYLDKQYESINTQVQKWRNSLKTSSEKN